MGGIYNPGFPPVIESRRNERSPSTHHTFRSSGACPGGRRVAREACCSDAFLPATTGLAPSQAQGWDVVPAITLVGGKEGDPRVPLVAQAVEFWNSRLMEIGGRGRRGRQRTTLVPPETVAGGGTAHDTADGDKEGSRLVMRKSTVRIRSPAPGFSGVCGFLQV
jgi:hypothetical protein